MPTKMNQISMDRTKEIHWQVAFKAAVDTINSSADAKQAARENNPFKRVEFVKWITQQYYDILVSGPQDTEGKE
tara:strand:- start:1091 stop:1312 length:222 start_codon:yes stop_codon:yes gene_type:complete